MYTVNVAVAVQFLVCCKTRVDSMCSGSDEVPPVAAPSNTAGFLTLGLIPSLLSFVLFLLLRALPNRGLPNGLGISGIGPGKWWHLPRNGRTVFESPYPRCPAISLCWCVVFAALLSRCIGWTRCLSRCWVSEAPVLPNCGLPNGLGISGIGPGRWPPPEWALAL